MGNQLEAVTSEDAVVFADTSAWETWLADHHDRRAEVWIKIAKKGSAKTTVTLAEALDVALCYGWIDSHRKGLDDDYYLQRYSPRRPKGSWSQVNVEKVEALIDAGRMRESGFAAIRSAKSDGRWDSAYVPQRSATVPKDLADALAANPTARERFGLLGKSDQYGLFLPLLKALTPASRSAQLQRILSSLTEQEPGA